MSETTYYDNCGLYIESRTGLRDKITAIDAIIDALESQALIAAGTSDLQEYQLNDGQTIIRQVYRGSFSIAKAIMDFDVIRQRYINRLNGRMFRAVDRKSFRNYGRW